MVSIGFFLRGISVGSFYSLFRVVCERVLDCRCVGSICRELGCFFFW